MADRSVCAPQFAESDAQKNTTATSHSASFTDADKVINTYIDSTQVEGIKSEEELLRDLLTDGYCHVCEAVLLFESQRVSHYEGKKHAQKVRVYLQAKRAENMNRESTGVQHYVSTDKDHFCELCKMVFSSHVVAKSHYEGKVHKKNLRKQGLQLSERPTEVHVSPRLSHDLGNVVQKLAQEGGTELVDTAVPTSTPSTEVDLKDPNKYCVLCTTSFNNPQMASQHYNGRKHQRNQSRQELLKGLGEDVQQGSHLVCQMCGVQFNSVEMYQAHMQGNKHQIREKKVIDLCKSQQKGYGTFADELSDYIQIQKARGINQRNPALPPGNAQKEDEKDEEEELTKDENVALNKAVTFPPTYNLLQHSHLGRYNPDEAFPPPYQALPWPSRGLNYSCPPPIRPGSGSLRFTGLPAISRRPRKLSSSSSHVTSSSYSSYSSSSSSGTSDNEDPEYRRREKSRSSRRERFRRPKVEDANNEEKRRRRWSRAIHKDSEERRQRESAASEDERKNRKKRKSHGKQGRREKKARVEDFEAAGMERVMAHLKPEDLMYNRKGTEVHIQAEINVEQANGGPDESVKPKFRKEKKKLKDKVDTRTEEEKLWDDSILGF